MKCQNCVYLDPFAFFFMHIRPLFLTLLIEKHQSGVEPTTC